MQRGLCPPLVGTELSKDGDAIGVVPVPRNRSCGRTQFRAKAQQSPNPAAAPPEVQPWGSCGLADGFPPPSKLGWGELVSSCTRNPVCSRKNSNSSSPQGAESPCQDESRRAGTVQGQRGTASAGASGCCGVAGITIPSLREEEQTQRVADALQRQVRLPAALPWACASVVSGAGLFLATPEAPSPTERLCWPGWGAWACGCCTVQGEKLVPRALGSTLALVTPRSRG